MSQEKIKGIVRDVNWRNDDRSLTFRLEGIDEDGNISGYTAVSIQDSLTIKGGIVEGDEVEVAGEKDKDGVFCASSIHNFRTKANIQDQSRGKLFSYFVLGAIAAGFLFLAVTFILDNTRKKGGCVTVRGNSSHVESAPRESINRVSISE